MDYATTARQIRRTIINLANRSGSPHVGSCLSCADILTVLYFDYLRLDPWEKRDICILSKAHAAMALYATLVERGIMSRDMLDGYYVDGGTLPAHLDRATADGIEVSGGSLGHGLPIGAGMATAFKRDDSGRRVLVVMGDGETQEGSVWEAALFAPRLGLDNLTALIDYNNLQGYGRACEICAYEPVVAKWEAFGWNTLEVDGHDHVSIKEALDADSDGRPKMIVAHTTKGKGVSRMEDQLIWHYYVVTDEVRDEALGDLR